MGKRVLVTGMTSRQCNETKNHRDVMVSWLIAEVCRSLGHEVEHRNPTIEETYAEFDHVFLGIAPLQALGSNRAYGALSCFAQLQDTGRLTLFLDDPSVRNAVNGFTSMNADFDRLIKPFFSQRLEYRLAVSQKYRLRMRGAVEQLAGEPWPTTLVPAFPWADLQTITRASPMITRTVGVDLTRYLPSLAEPIPGERPARWITEVTDRRWLGNLSLTWDVVEVGRGEGRVPRPNDAGLLELYGRASGVLDLIPNHGWWTSRVGYAAMTRTPYITRWQNVQHLGDPYTVLPATVEALSPAQLDQLAQAQYNALHVAISPVEQVKTQITHLMETQ